MRELFQSSNHVTVFNTAEFAQNGSLHDRAFCINVMSAIPLSAERERVLAQILNSLEPRGSCLFVVQYRNSDFNRMANLPIAEPWHDGFLLKSLRGYSFYALISPAALAKLLGQAGFEVVNQQLNQGSVYMWAIRPET